MVKDKPNKKLISVRLDPDVIERLKVEVEKTNSSQESLIVRGLRIVFSGDIEFLQKKIQERDEMINFLQNQHGVFLKDPVSVSSKMEKEKSIMLTKLAQELNLPKGMVLDKMISDPDILRLFIEKQKSPDLPQLENIEPENTPKIE